jgi:NQR2, RnfD, RnfE family
MLTFANPDCVQLVPLVLVYTPRSVPAAISGTANAKTRTLRPSSPRATDQVPPPSWLTRPPPARVPATTSPGVFGLKLIVRIADLPEKTEVHLPPPLVLRAIKPCESPASTAWLFAGSTARANNAARGWFGSEGSATQVESGSAARAAPDVASPMTQSPTIVARRREPGSDTERGDYYSGSRLGPFAYNPLVLSGGARELKARWPRSWIVKAGNGLDRAAFKPSTLPDDLVTAIALLPPVAAGLIIFRLAAVQILVIAIAAGLVGLIAARLIWRGHPTRPGLNILLAPVFGIALVGSGASLLIPIEISVLAVVLEVLRTRYMPAIRAQVGLLAYAVIALATRGAAAAYVNPADGKPFGDPIGTWYLFFTPASAPIDPVRLYVGNVPGPVFATSLLAVAVGIAWLAYARRVSIVLLFSFLVGSLVAIYTFHWDPLFQLDSGPTWFVAGLVLADRRLLPDSWAVRPTIGFAAGLFAVGLRRPEHGAWFGAHGLEVAFFVVATIQAVMAVVVIAYWSASMSMERLRRTRRLRQREANLRVVKTITRTS